MGRPQTECSTLGRWERMRTPRPAARIIATQLSLLLTAYNKAPGCSPSLAEKPGL